MVTSPVVPIRRRGPTPEAGQQVGGVTIDGDSRLWQLHSFVARVLDSDGAEGTALADSATLVPSDGWSRWVNADQPQALDRSAHA
jgi:hypothetical protein